MSDVRGDGKDPSGDRPAATRRRDTVLTVVLVGGLLAAVLAIVALDLTPPTGTDEPVAGAPATSEQPTPEESPATRTPGGQTSDRLPDREGGDPSPTTQAAPLSTLPPLARLDRRLGARGLERVRSGQVDGLDFRVATFNILGASHTRGPSARRGYASAERRLGPQLDALAAEDVEVVGAQEFQQDQVRALERSGADWAIFPGLELDPLLADNSILWRPAIWERLRTQMTRVPYFGGNPMPMPQVLLRHRETGQKVWFANFHNPADSRGPAARFRQRALEIEADLARRLGADGTPVILTGDMNDREAFACPFSRLSGMVSADGARTRNGRCELPRSMFVDWIWGSTDLAFSDFFADRSIESRRLSDHPLITAQASIPGVEERRGCRTRISRSGPAWYCRA